MSLALARKYRPQNFLQVIGQDPIVQTLKNAIENDQLHHAYLFTGVRGVGKTSMARILAKSINCMTNGPIIEPCETCSACMGITKSNYLDVIEIDGASHNLVDDVRELREQVKYLPSEAKYKIVIIDEVHMLSTSAFNALLKTLEEPPEHVIFIFATTESHKIPITILSRCQKYDFRKLSQSLLAEHIQKICKEESIQLDDESVQLIASCALGSVRDALSLLDQVRTLSSQTITADDVRQMLGLGNRLLLQNIFQALTTQTAADTLKGVEEADQKGLDFKLLAEDLLKQYRDLIIYFSTKSFGTDLAPQEQEFLTNVASQTNVSLALAQQQILYSTLKELSYSSYPKTVFEIGVVKIHQAQDMIDLTSLVAELKNRKAGKASSPRPAAPARPRPQPSARPAQAAAPAQKPQASHNITPAQDWYELVKWITKQKPPLGSLLQDAKPLQFGTDLIEIGFPQTSPAKGIVIERASQFKELLQKHFGKDVPFKVTNQDDVKKKS